MEEALSERSSMVQVSDRELEWTNWLQKLTYKMSVAF
jgi:hypothetical protein